MSINNNRQALFNNCDDNYRDVLSALSQLDDSADIDYVKENYKFEQTYEPRRRRELRPLQHAARFLHSLVQKKCA